jgi:hypothetical protein
MRNGRQKVRNLGILREVGLYMIVYSFFLRIEYILKVLG